MDELISKRAVIEAIEKARANVGHNLERSIGKSIIEILDDVGRDVNGLPSAQPTFDARDTQYNLPIGTDLISRAQAIDALRDYLVGKNVPCDGTLTARLIENEVVNKLPSALGANLAEVGTDCISRQAAINAIDECYCGGEDSCGEPWIYQENAVEAIQTACSQELSKQTARNGNATIQQWTASGASF